MRAASLHRALLLASFGLVSAEVHAQGAAPTPSPVTPVAGAMPVAPPPVVPPVVAVTPLAPVAVPSSVLPASVSTAGAPGASSAAPTAGGPGIPVGLSPLVPAGANATGPFPCAPPPPPAGYAYFLLPANAGAMGSTLVPTVVGPDVLDHEPGQIVPPGYRVEQRARRGLVIAGSVTAGVPFVVSFLTGLSIGLSGSRREGEAFWPLMLPVVGPFVTMGTSGSEGAGTLWLALDGLAQVGGVAMLVGGLVAKTPKLVRETPTVSLVPSVDVAPGRASATWTF
ncbi:MAG: hypothetical protein FJ096_22200 [Deltaproteobacteria bacterium]|nr:hypothetical protein [Deltaproteobacteria bacterium]